ALKQLPQEKIELATIFGVIKVEPDHVVVNGTAEYERSFCEASLKRLGVYYIDLYYVHRIDMSVPIEETEDTVPLKSSLFSGFVMFFSAFLVD
ncbi:palmitoyltransferase akr1, partial [Sarracenia purpurea var. burkii]